MAEGVGFEPTVGFPTLDFESSALNRTQPPFRECKENAEPAYAKSFRVTSIQGRTSNAECNRPRRHNGLPYEAKNVTILGLPCVPGLLHLVCPHGQPRYYLLLTGIHRFLAPLFTSIRNLFGRTSTPPYRHDSTQTWNSARFTK